jgi:hypothetical protein
VPAYCDRPWRGKRRGNGLLKVGYTSRDAHERIREQIGASSPEKDPYNLVLDVPARTKAGRRISDHDVHRIMKKQGVHHVHKEWFEATEHDVRRAITALGGGRSRKNTHGGMDLATILSACLLTAISFAILYPNEFIGPIEFIREWARYQIHYFLQKWS